MSPSTSPAPRSSRSASRPFAEVLVSLTTPDKMMCTPIGGSPSRQSAAPTGCDRVCPTANIASRSASGSAPRNEAAGYVGARCTLGIIARTERGRAPIALRLPVEEVAHAGRVELHADAIRCAYERDPSALPLRLPRDQHEHPERSVVERLDLRTVEPDGTDRAARGLVDRTARGRDA